ncbi:hypothetical protein Taro_042801 [Colocasia esculenta]|uniref:VOC domain-containing protein n=1 Tax=Colocasia esculenta TaxID=4460 RepID=A0A843WQI0_COLES|nr:hypothetical protein [Colocasia esculenta]
MGRGHRGCSPSAAYDTFGYTCRLDPVQNVQLRFTSDRMFARVVSLRGLVVGPKVLTGFVPVIATRGCVALRSRQPWSSRSRYCGLTVFVCMAAACRALGSQLTSTSFHKLCSTRRGCCGAPSGEFGLLEVFLARSRPEDVAWSGGDAVPCMVFAFFAKVLGFQRVETPVFQGMEVIWLQLPGSPLTLHLIERDPQAVLPEGPHGKPGEAGLADPRALPRGHHICFAVSNYDEFDRGVPTLEKTQPDGKTKQVFFFDPDGKCFLFVKD